MSRKTVEFQNKIAQAVRAGRDVSVLLPQGRAIGKGVRGGWELSGAGFRHVSATNGGAVCTLPMNPDKQARLARLAK